MKRYLFPIISVILGISLFALIWFLLVGKKEETPLKPPSFPKGEISLPKEIEESGANLLKINQKDSLGYFKKDNYLYFFDLSGNLYFYDLNSNQLFEETGVKFENLIGFKVSPNKEKLILIWQENNKKRFSLFDLKTKKVFLLPEVNEVNFSLFDSNKGVFFKEEKEKSSVIGEIDFSAQTLKPLYKIDAYDLLVYFPQKDLIVFLDRPSHFVESSVFFLDLKTKKVENLIKKQAFFAKPTGVMIKFFDDGSFLLAFPSLRKLQFFSKERKLLFDFDFFTFPEKCQKNENLLFCAAPLELDEKASLPDEWYQGKLNFPEAIYKINLENGLKEKIYQTEISDIIDLEVISSNQISFFDRVSGSVYLFTY